MGSSHSQASQDPIEVIKNRLATLPTQKKNFKPTLETPGNRIVVEYLDNKQNAKEAIISSKDLDGIYHIFLDNNQTPIICPRSRCVIDMLKPMNIKSINIWPSTPGQPDGIDF